MSGRISNDPVPTFDHQRNLKLPSLHPRRPCTHANVPPTPCPLHPAPTHAILPSTPMKLRSFSHAAPFPHPEDLTPVQIRIRGYQFDLQAPYSEGHQLTLGEAQALNVLRGENIQNNVRKAVVDAAANLQQGVLLAPQVLADLQVLISKYDSRYQFPVRHSPRERVGEIEVEVRAVAEERAETHFRGLGIEPSAAAMAEMALRFAGMPSVHEEARQRVTARRAVTGRALEDLL